MGMKQVPTPKPKIHLPDGSVKVAGEEEQKPLLQITLPTPRDGNPEEPLSIGRHNAAAQANFKQVANLLMKTISNQKLMSMAIVEQETKIKDLVKSLKSLSSSIRKSLKENNDPIPNK